MKYRTYRENLRPNPSPSLRGRGLKYQLLLHLSPSACVALFARAWIEIPSSCVVCSIYVVALFARAWIEIQILFHRQQKLLVALFARAWIEIARITPTSVYYNVALFARAWIEINPHFAVYLLA